MEADHNPQWSKPGELVETPNGVKILGWSNWPGRIPAGTVDTT